MREVLKISTRLLLVLSVLLFSLRPSLVNRLVPTSWEPVQSSSSSTNRLEEKSPFAVTHATLRCSFNREDKQQAVPVMALRSYIDLAELTPFFGAWGQTPKAVYAVPSLRTVVLRI